MISLPYFDSRQSPLLLQAVLEASSSGVIGETKDGKVVVVNARFLEMVGWQGGCSGNESLDQFVAVWASRVTQPQVLDQYFKTCRTGNGPGGTVELQPTPGYAIQAQFRELKGKDGSRYRLWYFQEWKTSALAWVSHEIKNPLNAVLGFSELLAEALENSAIPEAALESLRGLRSGARHLQSVLEDLLNLSRLESGAFEPSPEWVPLGRVIEDLTDLFRGRLRRRGLDFLVQAAPAPSTELWVDPGRLTQILGNFLSNSLRFTKQGWVALQITQSGDRWEFSVEDTGVGIPEDQQKVIFEPFVQKRNQDPHLLGGSGLGLAICRTLAQTIGARLDVTSSTGKGSRFSATFDHLKTRSAPVAPSAPKSLSTAGATILVADDERSNHLLVQGFLRGTHVSVLSAFDGYEAVKLWKEFRPPVVLMDLRMPGCSGTEAAEEIRALDTEGQTSLLAMSATQFSATERKEGSQRWSGYLEKPFGKRDFLNFLGNHLTFVDESSTKP